MWVASLPPVTRSKPVAFHADLPGSWDTRSTVFLPNTARREHCSPVRLWGKNPMHWTLPTVPLSAEQSLVRGYCLCTTWAERVAGATPKKWFCLFSSLTSVPLSGWEDWTEWTSMKFMLLWRRQHLPSSTDCRCQALQQRCPTPQAGWSLTR